MVLPLTEHRLFAAAAFSLAVVMVAATASTASQTIGRVPEKRATELLGSIGPISEVPGTGQAFAIGAGGNGGCLTLRWNSGHWNRVSAPKVGARSGGCSVYALAAGSSTTVWAAGSRGPETNALPTIWRWTGTRFDAVALPDTVVAGDNLRIEALSANSARNAWAVGRMTDKDNTPIALHWNGSRWSVVALPRPARRIDQLEVSSVSTSGPNNAWALGSADGYIYKIYRWDGHAWTVVRRVEAGRYPNSILTHSATRTYVVGGVPLSKGHTRSFALSYNGKTWTRMPFASNVSDVDVFHVASHGATLWAIGAADAYHTVVLDDASGKWKLALSLSSNYQLGSLSQVTSHGVLASGDHLRYPSGPSIEPVSYTYITKFDGHHWKEQPSR